MQRLSRTEVHRGGVTSRYQFYETDKVSVGPGNVPGHEGDLRLSFAIDSKGGGKTAISVYVDPRDCLAMLRILKREQRKKVLATAAQALQRQERDTKKLRLRVARMRGSKR
jgi:hypothetical protein